MKKLTAVLFKILVQISSLLMLFDKKRFSLLILLNWISKTDKTSFFMDYYQTARFLFFNLLLDMSKLCGESFPIWNSKLNFVFVFLCK